MESNPIYRLEMQMMRYYYVPFILFGIGCVMGFYLLLRSWLTDWDMSGLYGSIISIIFYSTGTLLIPIDIAGRFGRQQMEEDLILCTPLSGSAVLWGKLRVAINLILCLHVPCLPELFLLLFQTEDYVWFIGHLSSAGMAICLTMTGLSFMAGARTLTRRIKLIFLGNIFVLGMLFFAVFGGTTIQYLVLGAVGLTNPNKLDWLFIVADTVIVVCYSCMAFLMGIRIFDKNEEKQENYRAVMMKIALFGAGFIFIGSFIVGLPFLLITWTMCFLPLIIAMSHNNSR